VNSSGELFVGTENGGINYYDRLEDEFFPISSGLLLGDDRVHAEVLSKTSVSAIATDRFGQIWVGALSNGLFIIQRDSTGNFVSVKHFSSESDKNHFYVNDVKADLNGNIWIAANEGLFKAGPKNVASENQNGYLEKIPTLLENVGVLHFDRMGNLWVGANDKVYFGAVEKLDKAGKLDLMSVYNNYTFQDLTALHYDSFGRLWVGTEFGLYLLQNMSPSEEDNNRAFKFAKLHLYQPQDGNTISI